MLPGDATDPTLIAPEFPPVKLPVQVLELLAATRSPTARLLSVALKVAPERFMVDVSAVLAPWPVLAMLRFVGVAADPNVSEPPTGISSEPLLSCPPMIISDATIVLFMPN